MIQCATPKGEIAAMAERLEVLRLALFADATSRGEAKRTDLARVIGELRAIVSAWDRK